MYSRIGCCIEYMDLTEEQKNVIIDNWYREIISCLNYEEGVYIKSTHYRMV